jgi:hypothetical protein
MRPSDPDPQSPPRRPQGLGKPLGRTQVEGVDEAEIRAEDPAEGNYRDIEDEDEDAARAEGPR